MVPGARSPSQYGVATSGAAMAANKWKKKARGVGVADGEERSPAQAEKPPFEWAALAARVKTPPVLPSCGRRSGAGTAQRPARVESAMSWNAAVNGDGGVASRALNSDMSWLTADHHKSGSLSSSPAHEAAPANAHLESFFRQHEPSLDTSYCLARGKRPGRQRAASDVRFGKVGTLAQHHRLAQERLLVARFVDELRRRNALGYRAPSRCDRTGATRWRSKTPEASSGRALGNSSGLFTHAPGTPNPNAFDVQQQRRRQSGGKQHRRQTAAALQSSGRSPLQSSLRLGPSGAFEDTNETLQSCITSVATGWND